MGGVGGEIVGRESCNIGGCRHYSRGDAGEGRRVVFGGRCVDNGGRFGLRVYAPDTHLCCIPS